MTEMRVVKVPSLITLSPSKLRHPIRWWRLRHLRKDIEVDQLDLLAPAAAEQVRLAVDHEILFGSGSPSKPLP